MIQKAVEELCARFDANDYNPTPIIDLGALVANADGVVNAEEIDALCDVLEPMLGAQLNAELTGYLVEASLKVIRAAGVEARIRLLAEILMDCDAVEEGIVVALALAFASEGLSPEEQSVIASLARAADLPRPRLDELTGQVKVAFGA